MKKLLMLLMRIYLAPLNMILRASDEGKQKGIVLHLMELLACNSVYSQVSFFPKDIDSLKAKATKQDFSNVAILIQGPLIMEDNFTVNTIKMYRRFFDHVQIILSTWADSDMNAIEQIKAMNVHVVLNEYPQINGVGNINYQLTTSLAGVKEAESIGVEYVFKTRTDQRYYNPCALSLLAGIYKHGKLIMLGGIYNSFCEKYFQISDFMAYGDIPEMKRLYSLPMNNVNTKESLYTRINQDEDPALYDEYIEMMRLSEENIEQQLSAEYQRGSIHYANPETLITYGYFLQKENIDQYNSLQEAYKHFLQEHIIIADADSLGFYWPKYIHRYYRKSYFDRDGKLDMARWLSILAGEGQR